MTKNILDLFKMNNYTSVNRLFEMNNSVYQKGGSNMKNKIAAVRESKYLEQQELAAMVGCSPNWLCKIEKGRQNPGFKLAKRIAKALEVAVDDVFFE
jgi:DNA-binding XRE family transcriptional regulator